MQLVLEVTLKGETYTYKGDAPGAFQFLDALIHYFDKETPGDSHSEH